MPRVLDALRIAPDEQVGHVPDSFSHDRLAAVECALSYSVQARLIRDNLDEHIVAPRTGDDSAYLGNLHRMISICQSISLFRNLFPAWPPLTGRPPIMIAFT